MPSTGKPAYTIVVDELELPQEERGFSSKLEALGPDYEIQIALRESAWAPQAIEHVKIFIESHQAAMGAIAVYILKTATDIFKPWAIDRLRRAPANTEVLIIYGPDGRILKKVTVRSDSTREE
jgi:hypothetical protein